MSETHAATPPTVAPLSSGRFDYFRFDLIAGFLVFLIAMPLCLAIARASGFPAIAGIWTAVVGGVICTLLSNSELTIKGPAAGLIVIVVGAVTEFSNAYGADLPDDEKALLGYRLTLGIGVASGILQILFGLARAGRLVDFFPLTPVHGMLASIGIIIISKQSYEVLGATAPEKAGPLRLLWSLPSKLGDLNPEIAIIGGVSLAILFGLMLIRNRWVRMVPAQLVVLVVAIPLGMYFDLEHHHVYLFPAWFFDIDHPAAYEVGPEFLVTMPDVINDPASAFAYPDFRGLASLIGLKYLVLFSLIGSLESLLSAKAIDLLDPWKRKTNFDRDLLAVGVANTISASLGGLPMISEIVRSSANINNGARTRLSNLFHGLFLLGFVLLAKDQIHQIPLAALGAMLVYTGFRLASPSEFVRTYKIGTEQFMVFVGTILATLATDLLVGIAAGIGLKIAFHLWNGVRVRMFFKSDIEVRHEDENTITLAVKKAAVFSNWMGLSKAILEHAEDHQDVILDLSETCLVDHSVMEKLHELEHALAHVGKHLSVKGLEGHVAFSQHPLAARKRVSEPVATANV